MSGPPDFEEIYEAVEYFLDTSNYDGDIDDGFDLFREAYKGYREEGGLSGVWDYLQPEMVSVAEFMREGNVFFRLGRVKNRSADEALSYFEDLFEEGRNRFK